MALVNENNVLEFYLSEMDKDNINFLKNRPKFKTEIRRYILNLKEAENMHEKIEASKKLWKLLFESAMSYIDPDKRGYDELFSYFDEFVNFEELIFASDSFYRDHTVHCLWVYFLGEYITKNKEYGFLFKNQYREFEVMKELGDVFCKLGLEDSLKDFISRLKEFYRLIILEDSKRCIVCLTHDLGYPLKKINKINKSIGNILPYFSINNFSEFKFNFDMVQKNNIDSFLQFLSNALNMQFGSEEGDEEAENIERKIFITENGVYNGLNKENLEKLTEQEIEIVKKSWITRIYLSRNTNYYFRYSKDFEEYQHGIMSAFLLMRTVKSFANSKLQYSNKSDISSNDVDYSSYGTKREILMTVSNHTSSAYRINDLADDSAILTFIDELEEFSRISRANQNRQYVAEFCKTDIYVENEVFCIDFIFDNEELDNLDPEKAFKGRCKRFLTLFDIPNLSDNLKLRLRCIGKLSYDTNVYSLEIGKKYAKISINDEEKDIPKYLKGRQFYTREEYENL
ncbi:hypothetical protein IAI10_02990 [Clostridium sp. 19966]|uniref:hypothetical protein n=1 Tax=Clostridium sp. 19966 TaxID=2768166 RepID=UPI0028DD8002|nr:hypothetical protein [Clostridium sp. 19966]MDT8715624.1 hypothetical protein [Clostridium sp. 19966]